MDSNEQYCQEKTIRSGSSFYYSFLFLPPKQRTAIQALYAFCREVDDIVDECQDKSVAQHKLSWWSEEIKNLYAKRPEHPISQSLLPVIEERKLPKRCFEKILEGMQMDLGDRHYSTFDDLYDYCYNVASAPGILAAHIFGYTNEKTLEYAENLGVAFQLINIIRDIGEDCKRGRIYIPKNEMKSFSVTVQDFEHQNYSQQFKDLMLFQANRARSYYEKAVQLLPSCDKGSQKPGLIMASLYLSILDKIIKKDFEVLHQKVKLTPIQKLWIAWRSNQKLSKETLII